MHSKNIDNSNLQVQLARRQPQIEPINDASSSAVWSTIGELCYNCEEELVLIFSFSAASNSQKGSHKDKREMVVYEDMFG